MTCEPTFTFPDFIYQELDEIQIMESPISDEDVTLESNMTFQAVPPPVPDAIPSPLGPPDRAPVLNPCNFRVEISSADTNKKKYLYSVQLNRIYVDMNCDFAVQFSWAVGALAIDRVFVRATVVFAEEAQAEKRVERCVQHRHDNTTLAESIRMNVLRSSREVGTAGVRYAGDPSRPDSWYSVLVELTQPPAAHAYKFVCKNSCSSGINRRPINIIFTLEDIFGNVYGREITGARVCSCPRRDLLKDEEGVLKAGKKRVSDNQIQPPKGKKVKIEVDTSNASPATLDQTVLTLPQLQVVGGAALTAGLEMMVRMMEQGSAARPHDATYLANCNAAIAGLKAAILQYRGPQ